VIFFFSSLKAKVLSLNVSKCIVFN
jgi:hypothetical protein